MPREIKFRRNHGFEVEDFCFGNHVNPEGNSFICGELRIGVFGSNELNWMNM
jgi:hypothetical protein